MPSILIVNQQRDLPINSKRVKKIVAKILEDLHIATDELTLHFVTEKRICEVHKQIFDNPSPTDCITIPIDPLNENPTGYHILGEAFVCPKTAINYAKANDLDPHEELYRYIIHCLLHFAGFTDDTPQKRRRMRQKETLLLNNLSFGFLA